MIMSHEPDDHGVRTGISERLAEALQGHSVRGAAREAAVKPETLRRYLQQVPDTIVTLARVCATHDINPNWLLLGRGPKSLRLEHEDLGQFIASSNIARLLAELVGHQSEEEGAAAPPRSGPGSRAAAGEHQSPAVALTPAPDNERRRHPLPTASSRAARPDTDMP